MLSEYDVHLNAVGAVAGDDIAGVRIGAADDIRASFSDQDAIVLVGDRRVAQGVGADEIIDNDFSAGVFDDDSVGAIAGNDVSPASHRAADCDRVIRVKQVDPVPPIAQRSRASDVDADVIALDDVVAVQPDVNAVGRVARDEVSRPRRSAADGVAGCAGQFDAVRIGDRGRARCVGADVVALDHIAANKRSISRLEKHADAVTTTSSDHVTISRDHVTIGDRGPADRVVRRSLFDNNTL